MGRRKSTSTSNDDFPLNPNLLFQYSKEELLEICRVHEIDPTDDDGKVLDEKELAESRASF